MTAPIIPCLDHEIQINHLDEAIAKFVTGEIDYIVCTGVREDTRENIFQITRKLLCFLQACYTTVEFGSPGQRGPVGIIVYDDVKKTMLDFIDAFEAHHGLRSHEQPEKMFIYIGGCTVRVTEFKDPGNQEIVMAEEFVFPNATEMLALATATRDAIKLAEREKEDRLVAKWNKKVMILWDKTLPKVAALIQKAAVAGESTVVVYDNSDQDMSSDDLDSVEEGVSRKLHRFLQDKGYTVVKDSTDLYTCLTVVIIPKS